MIIIFAARQELTVSTWAGGATTELCIFPEESSCAARNFAFRVSSATVELAESEFSDFMGYTRHIMPLEGSMELWHDGVFAARLQPYEDHTFDGAQKTRSVGMCVDFNLIHKPELGGELYAVRGNTGVVCVPNGYTGIYARCDELVVSGVDKGSPFLHTLNKGDFLLLHYPKDEIAHASKCEIQLAVCRPEQVLAVIATVCGAGYGVDC